ncbi:MAG TPA: hypothetical protein VGC78_04870 [Gaiellaceae bacterium]|jgi:hypothetical protein
MSAAHEKAFDDAPEASVPRRVAEAVPAAAEPAPRPKGRVARTVLVLAVIGVEVVWLGVLAYFAWQLILLL